MKKLLAVLMAALMALSCTLALAEGGDIAAPGTTGGVIITSDIAIDREVLAEILSTFGMADSMGELADTVAAVISELGERLVVAGNGIEYELSLKGSELLNLSVAGDENGLSVVSSLIPEHVLTVPADMVSKLLSGSDDQEQAIANSLAGIDTSAAREAVMNYLGQFLMTAMSSVTPHEPEQGEYEVGGEAFNTRTVADVDVKIVAEAANTLLKQITEDETIRSALEAVPGVNVSTDSLNDVDLSEQAMPAVEVITYMNADEQGAQVDSTSAVVFNVYDAEDETHLTTYGEMVMKDSEMAIDIEFPDSATSLAAKVVPADNGGELRVDITAAGMYLGADVRLENGDATDVTADIFVIDDEKPLLTSHSVLANAEVAPIVIDAEGKTVLSAEALTGEDSEGAISELTNDLLSNGLGGLVSTALSAMPEQIGALAGLMMGGASAEETPAA